MAGNRMKHISRRQQYPCEYQSDKDDIKPHNAGHSSMAQAGRHRILQNRAGSQRRLGTESGSERIRAPTSAKLCPTNISLSPQDFDKLKLVGHQTDRLPKDGFSFELG